MATDDSDFEREKWRADLEIRHRETVLKERDQINRDAEVEIKRAEQASSKWRSPLVVAILAATAAAAGNAVVAVINGYHQRELEGAKHTAEIKLAERKYLAEIALENSKAESTRILEMIKTGDPEKAADNLEFLLKAGLVAETDRVRKLTEFLEKRKPGGGPSLPSTQPRFGFEPTDALTAPLQATLQKLLDQYVVYLDAIGFPKSTRRVTIKIDKMEIINAYYSSAQNMIFIDHRLAGDTGIALREYNHHVLEQVDAARAWSGQYGAVESALADYFACSYLNNPIVGEAAVKASGDGRRPYIRTLLNERKFGEFKGIREREMPFVGAEIWGGAFWEIRTKLGREVADRILVAAWQATRWPDDEGRRALAFIDELLSAAKARRLSEPDVQVIRSLLSAREFPVGN